MYLSLNPIAPRGILRVAKKITYRLVLHLFKRRQVYN